MEQAWRQFEKTGSIADYLAYSRSQGRPEAFREEKERGEKDGADHCAHRYGAVSGTHRGV